MRLFVAIELPAEIKKKIKDFSKEIEKYVIGNFVSAKNMRKS